MIQALKKLILDIWQHLKAFWNTITAKIGKKPLTSCSICAQLKTVDNFPIVFRDQTGINLYVCIDCVEQSWADTLEEIRLERLNTKEEPANDVAV